MKLKLALMSTLILGVMACGMAANENALSSANEASDTTMSEATATPEDESSHTDADEEEASHDHDETSHDQAESTHESEEGSTSDEQATHGHPDESDTLHESDRTVEVTMSEFAFAPESIEVTAGQTVEFVVSNEGAIEHEFRLTSKHGVEDHISGGHNHDENADHDMLIVVPAGGTDSLMVTFTEDADVELFACLLPGHYEAGMEGELVIES